MTKRLVEIDDDLFRRARTSAGTDTIEATVEVALRQLVDRATTLRHVARLSEEGAIELHQLDEARRPRAGTGA